MSKGSALSVLGGGVDGSFEGGVLGGGGGSDRASIVASGFVVGLGSCGSIIWLSVIGS